ncbi:FHA domain-containing protein [Yoonia sp.]|uniref:FHA domain-containing protein n=1 Tax=Yoonia sp. TaxID=2212373 RepID=UPI002FDB2F8C
MKFIRDLLGKKRKEPAKSSAETVETLEQSYRDTIGSMVDGTNALRAASDKPETAAETAPAPRPAQPPADTVNIWDMEDTPADALPPAADLPEPKTELPAAPAAPAAARSPARARRTKTRLIGFEKSDGAVVDLFNDAPSAAAPKAKSLKFPVGWIVVVEGPGRGECFTLQTGMSQIGRGDDQAIQLDFGDNSISRSNHAAIVFDPETKEFLLGHGGKSNIVRLNNKPVISNESIKTGDVIKIGETVLRFVALCDKSFNWSQGGNEEDEDVAIA